MAGSEPSDELIKVAVSGARLDVAINRADKRNALSRPALAALRAAFAERACDESIKVAVLTGAGQRSFAAGGDLHDLATVRAVEDAEDMSRQARAALEAIRAFPVPVVAALNGDALGGGAELAVACDLRVAAAHAKIGFVQGRLAITTAWGGGIDLHALVGPSRALALLARSDLLTAQEAQVQGLVDAVAQPDEDLFAVLERMLAPMLRQARQVLVAFKALNRAVRTGAARDELERIETHYFARAWAHEDHWAAADAILARRPP